MTWIRAREQSTGTRAQMQIADVDTGAGLDPLCSVRDSGDELEVIIIYSCNRESAPDLQH